MPPKALRYRVEFLDTIMNTWRALAVALTRKDAEALRKIVTLYDTRMKEEE
jgi:hypothetical protein